MNQITVLYGGIEMSLLKRFMQGVFLSTGYALVLALGGVASPGTLGELAFSPIGLLALFSMMLLEAVYSFR